jgi:hypothetical protein
LKNPEAHKIHRSTCCRLYRHDLVAIIMANHGAEISFEAFRGLLASYAPWSRFASSDTKMSAKPIAISTSAPAAKALRMQPEGQLSIHETNSLFVIAARNRFKRVRRIPYE